MAKLKAPLFSLGASQQLGKALVFFGWKGLNVVREYVIPANPKTTLQTTQRGYMTDAVTAIHTAQSKATNPLAATDITAYGLWASAVQAATTWFNQAVRNWLDQKVAGKDPAIYRGGSSTPSNTTIAVKIYSDYIVVGNIETGNFVHGVSKTALINTQVASPNVPGQFMTATLGTYARKTKVFWQFRPATKAGSVGSNSGIYHATTT